MTLNMDFSQVGVDLSTQGWTSLQWDDCRDTIWHEARGFEPQLRPLGLTQQRDHQRQIRNDLSHWLSQEDNPSTWKTLEWIRNQLNEDLLLGLNSIEAQFCKYTEGGFYDWHLDVPMQSRSLNKRFLTFVYYLHSQWLPNWGGEIEFRDGTLIAPAPGRWLFFLSEKITHRVRPVHFDRWTLSGWMGMSA